MTNESETKTPREPVRGAMDEAGAAEYLNVSRSFLRQGRMNGDRINRAPAPPHVRCGRMIRYRLVDLDEWLSPHLVVSPNAVPPSLPPENRARRK